MTWSWWWLVDALIVWLLLLAAFILGAILFVTRQRRLVARELSDRWGRVRGTGDTGALTLEQHADTVIAMVELDRLETLWANS